MLEQQYYSKLDLIQKYNVYSPHDVERSITKIEISMNKFEKEQLENKDMNLEALSFYNFLLYRSPNLTVTTKRLKLDTLKSIYKKVVIQDAKEIEAVLQTFLFEFEMSSENVKVNKTDGIFKSIVLTVKITPKTSFIEIPYALMRRIGFEASSLNVEIFFKQSKFNEYKNIFPLWLL